PDVAVVVRTVDTQPKSVLLEKFPGTANETHGYPLYEGETHVFAFGKDGRTIAIAPNRLNTASELAESMLVSRPAVTKDGILDLLEKTDRERHFTIVFEPADLNLHQEALVPENVRPFLNALVLWFGDDVETVAWSLHRGNEKFFSQMYLRNQHVWTPTQLQTDMREKLKRLPRELYEAILKMQPKSLAYRKLVGRLPAMAMAFTHQTLPAIGADPQRDRFVQLTTVLPERAAPNLALASLLAWDESTRTDFSRQAPSPQPTGGTDEPRSLAERLKKPIDIEFKRTPLQEAFQYIGDETNIVFDIDGDALKFAGMTQNMPQNDALGVVPATEALKAILNRYQKEGLALVLDEAAGKVLVTTKAFAEKNGQKVWEVK
ncbi:MAG: hypothetical protein KY476_20135, partial [Planctomycetes bacterium]|nr:hypothetical protein [Planctomycetota bacterium]